MVGEEKQVHRMENTGTITVSQSGPYDFLVAELGANVQSAKDFPYPIEIGEWHTTARDFARTRDLFVCSSGLFDFAHTRLTLAGTAPTAIKAEDLVCQREEAARRGDTFRIAHADQLEWNNSK